MMRRSILVLFAGTFLMAEAILPSNAPPPVVPKLRLSGEAQAQAPDVAGTGSGAAPETPVAPADIGAPAGRATTPAAAATTPPSIDLTALRYFAQQGDTRRLEAEIARLRALYPDWTPPQDPLAIPDAGDPELDALWALYAQGRYGEVREGISARRQREPDWQVPPDLLDRLQVSENRQRLINASDLDQGETVVRIATETPSLLTCAEVDVLWRVARAFAQTDRADRSLDVYRYLLTNCDDGPERLASIQMAGAQLDRAQLDELLALERDDADGVGEFEPIRLDLARQAIAAAGADPQARATPDDVDRLTAGAEETGSASDFLLLGWYHLTHGRAGDAETAFRRSFEAEESPEAARGRALALIELRRFADAETVSRPYADRSDDDRDVYAAAAANLLAQLPPPDLSAEQLQAIVPVAAALSDANLAQQLGWYSYSLNQFDTADQWFATSLAWAPDGEPAAFGQALVRQRVGDVAGLQAIQAAWGARSRRIGQIGTVQTAEVAPVQSMQPQAMQPMAYGAPAQGQPAAPFAPASAAPAAQPVQPQPAQFQPAAPVAAAARAAPAPTVIAAPVAPASPVAARDTAPAPAQVTVAAPAAPARTPSGVARTAGCRNSVDPRTLSPEAALPRGWCLMEIDRPLEAAPAFEVALLSSSEQTRRDAAYGQSLAYLRAGLSDRAAVSATKAPQSRDRQLELEIALLTQQATDSFEARRPVEALMALDERARIAPERLDLMVLRGYAYLELRRFADAERVFAAAARAGSAEGRRGVNAVREARGEFSSGG